MLAVMGGMDTQAIYIVSTVVSTVWECLKIAW